MTWGNLLSSSLKLLILTPLILVKYDVDEIAFWYLLLTINSFVIVVDFGFYPSFSRVISYVYNGLDHVSDISDKTKVLKDKKPAWSFMQKVYGTINVTYISLTLLVVAVLTMASYYPISTVISRASNQIELWSSYVLFIISVVFAFFARRSDTIIIGTNHIALINRWNIINNLVNSATSIFIVYLGYGVFWLAVNQLLFSVILIIRNYYLERHICDGAFRKFKMFQFDLSIFKWVWSPTWKSGVGILASTGLTQVTGFIYTNMSSSAELASYLITLKLVTTVAQFSQAPFYSKIPLFSGLRVRNQITELSNRTMTAMFKSLMVFVFGISGLFFCGDYLLEFIGAKTELESPLFIIFMAFIWFFERHHAMHAQVYSTTNKIPFYKMLIITGLINLILMYILVPIIGVWGFPTSLAIANLTINNWWNVKISVHSLNQNFWFYFSKSALIPMCILILLAIIKLLAI
jgi:O-antigen/teichoic acid export membrane protein